MSVRALFGNLIGALGFMLVAVYVALLAPVLLLGIVAYGDYQDRGCPGAWQCSDASSVMNVALAYVLAAPVIWILFKTLRKFAKSWRGEAHA